MLPQFLKAFEGRTPMVPPGNKVMVILQFSGGNDGLNTVIPIRNDIYYRERPRLGIEKAKALLDKSGRDGTRGGTLVRNIPFSLEDAFIDIIQRQREGINADVDAKAVSDE